MLSLTDITITRRSAAMAPLSRDDMANVLDTCEQLLRERAQISEVLGRLPASFGDVRDALNELQRIIGR